MKFDKKIWSSKDLMTKTRVNAWIMKISTLFIALQPRFVVTLNIKPIYISKNSNKNVLKKTFNCKVILIISWSSPAVC